MKSSDQWVPTRLDAHFQIKHGFAFKGEYFADAGPFIVLTPGNFFDEGGFTSKDQEKYYTGEVPDGYILQRGDLLVAMTEQAEGLLGSSALIPKDNLYLHNQRLGLVVNLDEDVLDKRFLYYLFNTRSVRNQIRATASGTKVRHTSPSRIGEVQVMLPPIGVQRRIVDVVAAYDDLIENNSRRIAILEEMARAIYREWFVGFRFPGHEQVEMVESELGSVPAGWEVQRVGDRFTVVLGGTPSRSKPEYWQDGYVPWINSGMVNELRIISESEFITELGLRKSSTKLMPKRSTVVAITGTTLGQVSLLEIEACANQSVVGISDPSAELSEFLYLFFADVIHEIIQHASGGAQQHINKGIVEDVRFADPIRPVTAKFKRLVEPIFDQVANLLRKNANLRCTRDLLLPRLISGEIDVPAVEEEIAGAAA